MTIPAIWSSFVAGQCGKKAKLSPVGLEIDWAWQYPKATIFRVSKKFEYLDLGVWGWLDSPTQLLYFPSYSQEGRYEVNDAISQQHVMQFTIFFNIFYCLAQALQVQLKKQDSNFWVKKNSFATKTVFLLGFIIEFF